MDSKEAYRFKRELEELGNLRGRHTELVSVYIPDGYEITKVIGKLSEEQGTSQNIKSKSTRKNVTGALEKIIQHLKTFKRTPKNGLAVFCGNVSEREGVADIQLHSLIPPEPLKIALYRCSQQFVLDPLLGMIETKEVYGLVVMDRREADIAFLKGKQILPAKHMSSMVPGKFRAGGQSAQRFERVIEGMANDWYKNVAESSKAVFEGKELKGIVVGGPGQSKNEFIERLQTSLRDKIIGVLDLGYTGDYGLEELVQRSKDVLAESEIVQEKKVIQKLLNEIAKDGLAAYGKEEVKTALDSGAVKTLLLSEKIDSRVADEFVKGAEQVGTEIIFISTDTPEGEQLWRLGGFAAILRYRL